MLHGGETWPTKKENEWHKKSMIRWMCNAAVMSHESN